MIIQSIISGGQVGADVGGLLAGRDLGLVTGGWAPKGWRTEAGPMPSLADFGLTEHESEDYRDRTKANALIISEGTLIIGQRSSGSNLTEEMCRAGGKPCCWIYWPTSPLTPALCYVNPARTFVIGGAACRPLRLWLKRNKINTLNVAGNRESKNPGIQEFTHHFLMEALRDKD